MMRLRADCERGNDQHVYTPCPLQFQAGEALGHSRLPEVTVDLPAQDMEVVARRRHVDDLHVAVLDLARLLVAFWEDVRVVIAQLQEALDARRRVLWALAVVPMRERERQSGALQPLALARADELVNHDLGRVGKVADCSKKTGSTASIQAVSNERSPARR